MESSHVERNNRENSEFNSEISRIYAEEEGGISHRPPLSGPIRRRWSEALRAAMSLAMVRRGVELSPRRFVAGRGMGKTPPAVGFSTNRRDDESPPEDAQGAGGKCVRGGVNLVQDAPTLLWPSVRGFVDLSVRWFVVVSSSPYWPRSAASFRIASAPPEGLARVTLGASAHRSSASRACRYVGGYAG